MIKILKLITLLLFYLFSPLLVHSQTTKIQCTMSPMGGTSGCSANEDCSEDASFTPPGGNCLPFNQACKLNTQCCSKQCNSSGFCDVPRVCQKCTPDGQKQVENQRCCTGTFYFNEYCLKELPPPTNPLSAIIFKQNKCGKEVAETDANKVNITNLRTSQNYFYAFEFLLMGLYQKIQIEGSRNIYLSYFNTIGDLFEIAKMHFLGRISTAKGLKDRMDKIREIHSKYIHLLKTSKDFNQSAFVTNDSNVLELQKNYIQESYFAHVGNVYALIAPLFKIVRESIKDFYNGGGMTDRTSHIWNPGGGLPHPICSYQPGIIWRGHEMCSARVVVFDKTIKLSKDYRILVDPMDPSWPLVNEVEKVEAKFAPIYDCQRHDSLLAKEIIGPKTKSPIYPPNTGYIEFCHHRGNPVWNTLSKEFSKNTKLTNPYEYYNATKGNSNFVPFLAVKLEKKSQGTTLSSKEIRIHPYFCQESYESGTLCFYNAESNKILVNKEEDKALIANSTIFTQDIFSYDSQLKRLEPTSYNWFAWHFRSANNIREASRRYYMAGNDDEQQTQQSIENGLYVDPEKNRLEEKIKKAFYDYADKHAFIFKEDGDANSDKEQSAQLAYELFFRFADPGNIWKENKQNQDGLEFMNIPWYLYFDAGMGSGDDMNFMTTRMPHIGYFSTSGLFLSEILDELEQRAIYLATQYGQFRQLYTANSACLATLAQDANVTTKGLTFDGKTGGSSGDAALLTRPNSGSDVEEVAKIGGNSNPSNSGVKEGFNITTADSVTDSTKLNTSDISSQQNPLTESNTLGASDKIEGSRAVSEKGMRDRIESFKKAYGTKVSSEVQQIIDNDAAKRLDTYNSMLKNSTGNIIGEENKMAMTNTPNDDTSQIQRLDRPQDAQPETKSTNQSQNQEKTSTNNLVIPEETNQFNPFAGSASSGSSMNSKGYNSSNANYTNNASSNKAPIKIDDGLSEAAKMRQINNDMNLNLFDVVSTVYVRSGIKKLKSTKTKSASTPWP